MELERQGSLELLGSCPGDSAPPPPQTSLIWVCRTCEGTGPKGRFPLGLLCKSTKSEALGKDTLKRTPPYIDQEQFSQDISMHSPQSCQLTIEEFWKSTCLWLLRSPFVFPPTPAFLVQVTLFWELGLVWVFDLVETKRSENPRIQSTKSQGVTVIFWLCPRLVA